MKQHVFVLTTVLAIIAVTLHAEPPAKKTSHKRASTKAEKSGNQNTAATALAESANGWTYTNGEWVHPMGYKFEKGKILRTTAKLGQVVPNPPGKLALENPQKLTPRGKSPANKSAADNVMTATEKAAEARRKNLAPSYAPRVGSHL